MPLTIRQIERWTRRVTHLRSTDVRITKLQKGRNRKRQPVVRATTFTTHNDDGSLRRSPKRYKTRVTAIQKYKSTGKFRPLSASYVKCECTCAYFWAYGCEVELHKRGAADIKHSNGKDPLIRNPQGRPWACKHLLALFDEIIIQGL